MCEGVSPLSCLGPVFCGKVGFRACLNAFLNSLSLPKDLDQSPLPVTLTSLLLYCISSTGVKATNLDRIK